MAGALGLLLGGALGAAKVYGQEKMRQRQQQDEHRSRLADLAVQQGLQSGDPSFWDMPEVKKLVGDQFGPESPKMLGALTGALSKPLQGFPTMGGGAGGATPPASSQMIGAAGGGGQFSQPQQVVGKAPSQMPPMAVTGPGSPPEPTSVGSVSQQERHLGGLDTNDPQVIRDHLDKVYEYGRQFPGNARVQDAVKEEVAHWDNRLKDIEHQQDFDITKSQQLMEFGITKQQQEQFHQDSQAMHEQTLASLNQNRQFMQQMQTENQQTKRQGIFDQAQKNLASQTESIAKMLSTATPANSATTKSLLNQRNAQARQLKKQADAAGIDYDPEEFKPLTITDVPGWFKSHFGIGGSTPTVTEDSSASATASADAPTTSKSGRKIIADPKSPSGFSYAD